MKNNTFFMRSVFSALLSFGVATVVSSQNSSQDCDNIPAPEPDFVLAPPTPVVTDIKVCKGDAVDPMDGIVAMDYELIWFSPEDIADTAGKALTTAPVDFIDTDVPGAYKMYVAQRMKTQPYAQSDIVEFTVNVYGVAEPLDKSRHEYCASDMAEPLKVDIVEDHNNYLYADEVLYVAPGSTKPVSKLIPSTETQTTVAYQYEAFQQYTIPETNKTCVGDPIKIEVKVIAVNAPIVDMSPVRYAKSEGEATKSFEDILVKYPTAIDIISDPAYTLMWSVDKNGVYTKGSSYASKPFYDETVAVGTTERQERFVIWEVNTGNVLCMSDISKVDIEILSTPAPIVSDIEICENVIKGGSIPAEKEPSSNATLNDNYGTLNVSEYKLYWFTDKEIAEKATDITYLNQGSTTAPTLKEIATNLDMSDQTVERWDTSFYVVQSDGFVSSPVSELKIVVNATPTLVEIEHGMIEDEFVDLMDYPGKYWDNVNKMAIDLEISFDGLQLSNEAASTITKSGDYILEATSIMGCKSDPLTVHIQFKTDGVESIAAVEADEIINVYSISGSLIKANVKKSEALVGLKPGVYVVGREKVEVKE